MKELSDPEILERERQLIEEILAGNPERFYELIAPVERRVYMTAYEILQSPAEAEDVAQESILKAFRSLKTFRGDSKFSTWLFRITMNEARMRLRKHKEVSLDELISEDQQDEGYTPIQLADWREIPADAVIRQDLAKHLENAIASLPLMYREVLILRDIDGVSILQTAQVLELGISNVKARLLRARLMLRDYFVSEKLMSANAVAGKRRK
jgi:RNA polymerase sigma-70 factor (ECF subfamily)